MKQDIHISNYQMFCLLVMHSLGSSTLFARGIRAKQDAWIVEIVGLIIGFGIIWIHTELQKNYPEKNLAEISVTLFGKILGSILTIFFAGYFIWVSTLNFSEFSDLIAVTALQSTPIVAIQIIFIAVIVYLTLKNIEVMGRVSEILMPIVIFSLLSLYVLIAFSGKVNLKELLPILAKGMKPVLKEAYPAFSTFPYGEDVVFLFYYCYVNQSKKVRKYAFAAIFMLGMILVVSTAVIISVLGVTFASSSTIALIEVVKMINIGDIITNLDAIGVVVIFIGGLFKAMLFFYGCVLALSTLFKIKREILIIVMAVFLIWFNLTAIPNVVFHRFAGNFTSAFLHEIYTIYIPALLLIIVWLKNLNIKLSSRKNN